MELFVTERDIQEIWMVSLRRVGLLDICLKCWDHSVEFVGAFAVKVAIEQ